MSKKLIYYEESEKRIKFVITVHDDIAKTEENYTFVVRKEKDVDYFNELKEYLKKIYYNTSDKELLGDSFGINDLIDDRKDHTKAIARITYVAALALTLWIVTGAIIDNQVKKIKAKIEDEQDQSSSKKYKDTSVLDVLKANNPNKSNFSSINSDEYTVGENHLVNLLKIHNIDYSEVELEYLSFLLLGDNLGEETEEAKRVRKEANHLGFENTIKEFIRRINRSGAFPYECVAVDPQTIKELKELKYIHEQINLKSTEVKKLIENFIQRVLIRLANNSQNKNVNALFFYERQLKDLIAIALYNNQITSSDYIALMRQLMEANFKGQFKDFNNSNMTR